MHNSEMQDDDLDRFVTEWVYDIDRVLRRKLEDLKDDLASDDERIRAQAETDAAEILDWLLPPPPPLSKENRLKRAEDVMKDAQLPNHQRYAAALRALQSTGRRRGRPRDGTSQQAIRAYTLHLATDRSWREIALMVRGCKHKRPNPEMRSCLACADGIRDAVGRLESFLHTKGYHPDVPRRKEARKQI
jgi:hypothetical protein